MTAESQDKETLVFLPTYNERSTIDHLLDAILTLPNRCDVLVIDDNSPDGTGTLLKTRAAGDTRIKLIFRTERGGIGSAHRLGWLYARRFGYARIVTLDADLSHDPLDIPRLLNELDAGADVAIGSRFVRGGILDYKGWRHFLSRTANSLARMLLRLPIAEYTNSFRAARLDRVPAGLIEAIPNDGYAFFLMATVLLARQGLRLTEIPIHFYDRHSGASKMPRMEILRGAANLLYLTFHRRPFEPKASTTVASVNCSQCGEPYVVAIRNGAATCLRCMSVFG